MRSSTAAVGLTSPLAGEVDQCRLAGIDRVGGKSQMFPRVSTPLPSPPPQGGGSKQAPSNRCDLLHRPSRPPRPCGFCFRARRRIRAGRSGHAAVAGACRPAHRAADRAAEDRERRRPPGCGADRARPDLCEARTIPGDPAGRRRRQAGARSGKPAGPMAPFPQAEAEAAIAPLSTSRCTRSSQLRPAGGGRIHRAGASREAGRTAAARWR